MKFKPRLAKIKDVSDAKHNMKMTHFALDAAELGISEYLNRKATKDAIGYGLLSWIGRNSSSGR
ncbi:hypothetical protein [Thiocapsa rosea]|uniref:Uncharacterized protein n=1 Tax=Thiocapsa rosea TaxID=69360 RepID=A0A495V7C1_9GAMM|nr:hypothetical protein [Thiocapsa rosea]RKT44257.1 hypothetical protein BDD21_1635 [Thiocapsa rosea]